MGKWPAAATAKSLAWAGHLPTAGYWGGHLRESQAETTEGRLDNPQELIQLAEGFHTARELLDHAALSTGGPDEEEGGRVRLMTLHRSKGLEFTHVFLPGWHYVALTRGMRRVTISHCGFRRGSARPSPFLYDIPDRNRARASCASRLKRHHGLSSWRIRT